jgi:hypothetical protein
VIDVFVGAADGSGGDANEDLAGTWFRDRTIANFGPVRTVERSGFDDGNHRGADAITVGFLLDVLRLRRSARRMKRSTASMDSSTFDGGSSGISLP